MTLSRADLHDELQSFANTVLQDALMELRLRIIADLRSQGEIELPADKIKPLGELMSGSTQLQKSKPTPGLVQGFRKAKLGPPTKDMPKEKQAGRISQSGEVQAAKRERAGSNEESARAFNSDDIAFDATQSKHPRAPQTTDSPEIELLEEEDEDSLSLLEPDKADRMQDGRSSSFWSRASSSVVKLVRSNEFMWGTTAVVLLNSLLIGVQTDWQVRHVDDQEDAPLIFKRLDELFFGIFAFELCCRFVAFGCSFFVMEGWAWNVFDLLVVGLQLVDIVLHAVMSPNGSEKMKSSNVFKVLPFLRLIRILRLVRVLRLVEELREIVSGIIGSLKSLLWTMVLLFMLMYSCAVCITQVVADHLKHLSDVEHTKTDELKYYYGTMTRSILSLYESVSGGQSWDCMLDPLAEDISSLVVPLFCMYIAFCIFAVMNSVTGVFCEKANSRMHVDQEKYLAHVCKKVFARADHHLLTREQFSKHMQDEEFRDFFHAIDVHVSEADGLFSLLDAEHQGEIDYDQFIHGILRVRGPARSLDLALLMHESDYMFKRISEHIVSMEVQIGKMWNRTPDAPIQPEKNSRQLVGS